MASRGLDFYLFKNFVKFPMKALARLKTRRQKTPEYPHCAAWLFRCFGRSNLLENRAWRASLALIAVPE